MKNHYRLAVSFLFLALSPFSAQATFFSDDCPLPAVNGKNASFETAFTPDSHPTERVVTTLREAKHSIRVVAHTFISKDIAVELVKLGRNGRDVKILLDKNKNESGYTAAKFFITMDNPPHIPRDIKNQYENYILIDDSEIILGDIGALQGSYDEPKNSAGILIIRNVPELVKRYNDNWQRLWDGSQVMVEKISK
ncbi:MAG TPA: phospholipase D-like domain-containing protein [Rickettsiales bacterium]|nr:phospholipase D-like domain-containing protein [Rickettsiales bacterium]